MHLVVSPQRLEGQSIVRNVSFDNFDLFIEGWTSSDGLPSRIPGYSLNQALTIDSRGFFWIYPSNQLTRFDGKTFKTFDVGSKVTTVLEDHYGNLWLGTSSRNIMVFDVNKEVVRSVHDYLKQIQGEIGHLALPEKCSFYKLNGNIYLSDRDRIWQFDRTLKLVFAALVPQEGDVVYLPGSDRKTWKIVETNNEDHIFLVDSVGNELADVNILPVATHRVYGQDQAYGLWQIDYSVVRTMRKNNEIALNDFIIPADSTSLGRTPQSVGYSSHFTTRFVGREQGSELVKIAANNSSCILKADKSIFINLDSVFTATGIRREIYRDGFTFDGNNNFWFSASDAIFHCQLRPKNFSREFTGKSVRGLSIFEQNLFVCGYNFKTFVKNLRTEAIQEFNIHSTYSVFAERHQLWSGSNADTISSCNYPETSHVQSYIVDPTDDYMENRVFSRLTDSTLLIGNLNGTYEYNYGKQTKKDLLPGYAGNWASQDEAGNWWFATDNGLYDLAHKRFYFTTHGDLPLEVQHFYAETKDMFWLATNRGLIQAHRHSGILQVIDKSSGLVNENVHAVYPDNRGILWLSTDGGITAYDPTNGNLENFFDTDGLASSEQNYFAHTRGENGQLFFGGVNGITSFYPDSITLFEPLIDHDIQLGTVELYNDYGGRLPPRKVDFNQTTNLNIPPECEQFFVRATVPYYQQPKLHFEYRIEGFRPVWMPLENGKIWINELPAGRHTLEIRAFVSSGNYESIHKSVSIHREVYFYQKLPFWLSVLAVVIFSLVRLYFWKTNNLIIQASELREKIDQRTSELREQKTLLEKTNHKLRESNQAKTEMFNNLNHEFRTPLSIIIGSAENLENETPFSYLASGKITTIRKQAQKLRSMIEELLDLTQIDVNLLPVGSEAVPLAEFIKEQVGNFVGLAQQKQINYKLQLEVQDDVVVDLDRKKVSRIVQNLLSNALKYTPQQGEVFTTASLVNHQLVVKVADNGPGISEADQAKIFNRFFRSGQVNTLQQAGYGIGLSICKEYAKLLGGTVRVESKVGKGSCFSFTLPVKMEYPAAQERETILQISEPLPPVLGKPSPSSNKENHILYHVLVVEDNTTLLQMLVEQLSGQYRVTGVENGQLALDLLEEQGGVDVIISDVMMPFIDGQEFLRRIRKDPRFQSIPFLMLTALNDHNFKKDMFRLGVDAYVVKPFSSEELLVRIGNLINNYQIRSANSTTPAYLTADSDDPAEALTSHAQNWLDQLNELLQKEYKRTDLRVTNLALLMNMSERSLRDKMIRLTGIKPSAYITTFRLHIALELLEKGRYETVAEVAYHAGFKNAGYFAVLFKKAFGQSPSAYLKAT